jgi:hypothetical protein
VYLHLVVNHQGLSYGSYYMPKSIGTPALGISPRLPLEVKLGDGADAHATCRHRSGVPPVTAARSCCVRIQSGLEKLLGRSGYPRRGWSWRSVCCVMARKSALKGYCARGVAVSSFSTTCWNATTASASNWMPAQLCNSSSPSWKDWPAR